MQKLEFDNMIPFVLEQIKRRGAASIFYLMVNAGMLVLIPFLIWSTISSGAMTWPRLILHGFGGAIGGSLLVIPFHEVIHGVAYWLIGARRIKFGVDLQQFIFYVTADRYPVSTKQVTFLALLPFALINLVTIGIVWFIAPDAIIFATIFLLMHNLMCIGDFAIVNFLWRHGGKVYTYDEPEKKVSYFFERT
jgi:hypothetical protein